MIPLRPYQEEALAAMHGVLSGVVALPTGVGKTVCFAEHIRRTGARTLILAHRDELLQQAEQKLKMVWPEADVGIVKAERNEIDRWVTVASVQTLSRAARLEQLPNVDLVVVDEVHHATEASYRRVLDHFEGAQKLGFTATPDRTDGKPLCGDEQPFEKIVYKKGILEMIAAGWLCDLRGIQVRIGGLDLSLLKKRGGDYVEGELGAALSAAGAHRHVAEAYLTHAAGRKAIVFTPTVATAEEALGELLKRGVSAGVVFGDQEISARRATLLRFSSGDIRVLVNCAVLLEGYDEPSVDCIVMARPTRSRLLYTQAVGRGTRVFPNKEDCLVLDLCGEGEQETLASMLGVTAKSAAKGIAALVAERAAAGIPLETPVASRKGLHWIEDGSRYLLSCGQETLILFPVDLAWRISAWGRDEQGPPRLLHKDLSLEYAQGIAEDYARARGALVLASAEARWRGEPASVGQRETLEKWRRWKPGLTKGQAADLLTLGIIKGRERRRRAS